MKSIFVIIFIISLFNFPQDPIDEYLKREIKDLQIKGDLISKKFENNFYVFEVKDGKAGKVVSITLPATVYNSKEVYEFIEVGDYFFKVKGELKFRLGHKFDGNIEVKHFNLLPGDE